jgi:hypothetical protein
MKQTGTSAQQHMHAGEAVFHGVMILFTCGLWYPVYKHRKNQLDRTVKHYGT